jgi:hypothetical protein
LETSLPLFAVIWAFVMCVPLEELEPEDKRGTYLYPVGYG